MVLFSSALLYAQDGLKAGVSVGKAISTSTFSDIYGGGVVFGARVMGFPYQSETLGIGLAGSIGYEIFGKGGNAPKSTIVPVNINLIYYLGKEDTAKGIGTFGVGLYSISSEHNVSSVIEGSAKSKSSSSNFGFNIGGGINFKVTQSVKTDLITRFHLVLTKNETTKYMTVGLHFYFS